MSTAFPHDEKSRMAYMQLAMEQAHRAVSLGEVPVGCVIADVDGVVASAHNLRETRRDPTAHAEIIALREAARRKGTWHLTDCVLYVTLEPCPMCAGAIVNARLAGLAYGAADPKAGACSTLYEIPSDPRLNHVVPVMQGPLTAECSTLLTEFFEKLRGRRRLAD